MFYELNTFYIILKSTYRAVSIDDTVIVSGKLNIISNILYFHISYTGGGAGESSDLIVKFDTKTEGWSTIGHLKGRKRHGHGMSVISYFDDTF